MLSTSASVGWVLLIALLGANMPFITHRWMGLVPAPSGKDLGFRLLELLGFYGLVGGVAFVLEQRAGQIADQGWEFYAITLAVFVTLSFPGFTYCYLLNHRKSSTASAPV